MQLMALLSFLFFLLFLLGILGVILLVVYWFLGWLHKKRAKALLICGCIFIVPSLLILLFLFLAGALGIGPVPN